MSNFMCYDADGKTLNYVYQWDANRDIGISSGVALSSSYSYKIHMWNMRNRTAFVLTPTIDDAMMTVTIPTPLLETPDIIHICVYQIDSETLEEMTIGDLVLRVVIRERPSDYVSVYTGYDGHIADDLALQDGMLYLSDNGEIFGDGVDV